MAKHEFTNVLSESFPTELNSHWSMAVHLFVFNEELCVAGTVELKATSVDDALVRYAAHTPQCIVLSASVERLT